MNYKSLSFVLAFLALCVSQTFSQNIELGARAGVAFGAPIPVSLEDTSATGAVGIGPSAGIFVRYNISEIFSLQADISYTQKAAIYAQSYRRDTMVMVNVGGQDVEIPTFYQAFVEGAMNLGYIDIPIHAMFNLGKNKRLHVFAGPIVSIRVTGKDEGEVQIIIGEGGVFDDITQAYDNTSIIPRVEWGASTGLMYDVTDAISLDFRITRSFNSLYPAEFFTSRGFDDNPLYNTYFHFGVLYKFWEK